MTNLPIASHPPQSSGGIANSLQPNIPVDDQTARGSQHSGVAPAGAEAAQTKVAGGLPAVGDLLAEIAEPFSELLARQMDEAGSRTPIAAQDTYAVDSHAATGDTRPAANETQDQTAADANAAGGLAGMLAALLLQIPVSGDRAQRTEAGGLQEAGRSPLADSPLPMADRRQQTDPAGLVPLSTDVTEHVEMAANSASAPQTNTAQAITPSTLSAALPNMLNHNTVAATLTLNTPLGSNGWTEEFTQKINWMSTQQCQVAELHLSPPDLGPLDIVLKISGNQATALFTSPHGAVRDAVENALPKLREILADNGIMLGNATVSDQSPQDRRADQHMNQGFGMAAQRTILEEATNSAGLPAAISPDGPSRRHNGMVDTFA